MRVFASAIIIFSFAVQMFPAEQAEPATLAEAFSGAFLRDDTGTTLAELRLAESSDPKSLAARELDYLAAKLSFESGDKALAAGYFLKNTARASQLAPLSLFHLAGIARVSGGLLQERILLEELTLYYPQSIARNAAERRITENFFESRDLKSAILRIESPKFVTADDDAKIDTSRSDRLMLARAYAGLGEAVRSRQIIDELIRSGNSSAPDDVSLAAVRMADAEDAGDAAVPKLSPEEHIVRGRIYQFNRDFAAARGHFLAIVNGHSEFESASEATYLIGRGFAQERNFSDAIVWFERVAEQYTDEPIAKDALLQLGSAYARVGKARESAARYSRYVDSYPDDERIDRAYLNPIDVSRDLRTEIEALRKAAAAAEKFRGKTAEAQAVFAEARIHIALADWPKALDALDRLSPLKDLGGNRVPGGTTRDEVQFLRGLVLEQLGRFPDAIDAFLAVPEGRNSYYGWRATERLQELGESTVAAEAISVATSRLRNDATASDGERQRKALQSLLRIITNEAERSSVLARLREVYAQTPGYSRLPLPEPFMPESAFDEDEDDPRIAAAKRLYDFGIYDEAAFLLAEGNTNVKDAPSLTELFAKSDQAYFAVRAAEPLWRSVPEDYFPELLAGREARFVYPAPFRRHLLEATSERNIDPRLLLAIMRQESRFRPDVKSSAAARGLMQFIPSTSRDIARELRMPAFSDEHLFDANTAIIFGAQYVSGLFRMFPNQPEAVAASYNGGEDNMQRWLTRSKAQSPDRYVSEIAFAETKDYVQKVMANYRMYQLLYDDQLRPRGK